MRLRPIACMLAALAAVPAQAALKEGQPAPAFTAQASLAGKALTYSLKDGLAKGPVVVYFFPAAFTTGCNVQAHTFSENYDKFASAGATIVGVSLDSIDRLNTFSADPAYCAGKLTVASDTNGKIAKAFDLKVGDAVKGAKDVRGIEIDHGFAERTTFIVGRDGAIAATVSGEKPEVNVQKALEAVRRLNAAH